MKQLILVASLILVGYILVPDHEHVPPAAQLTDEDGDCWTGELSACDDLQKASEDALREWAKMLEYHYKRIPGYDAILEKVGKDVEQLEAEYGDVELALISLGCEGQAPGFFPAVLRSGDLERDHWCSRAVAERLERVRAD